MIAKHVVLYTLYSLPESQQLLKVYVSPRSFASYLSRNNLVGVIDTDKLELSVNTTKTMCLFKGTMTSHGRGTMIQGTFHDPGDTSRIAKGILFSVFTVTAVLFLAHITVQSVFGLEATIFPPIIAATLFAGLVSAFVVAFIGNGVYERQQILDFLHEILQTQMLTLDDAEQA